MKHNIVLGVILSVFSYSILALTLIRDEPNVSVELSGIIEYMYNNQVSQALPYTDDNFTHYGKFDTGSTRFTISIDYEVSHDWFIFSSIEEGYSYSSNQDQHKDRLLFLGVENVDFGQFIYGVKQWSNYSLIASFTDKGRLYGSKASNMYNYEDMGESSGSGRAKKSFTCKYFLTENTMIGVEGQLKRENVSIYNDNTITLKNGFGLFIQHSLLTDLQIGIAYHNNTIDNVSVLNNDTVNALNDLNVDNSDTTIIGIRYDTLNFYIAGTASYGINWHVNPQSYLFDSIGLEFYTAYFFNNINLTFNFNMLHDYNDFRAKGYRILTYIPGIEYHFIKDTFFAWFEYQRDNGRDVFDSASQSYVRRDDQLAVGFRYVF